MAPGLWGDWLGLVAQTFGGFSALSVVHDKQAGAADLLGVHNISADALRLYGEYYHQHDLWTQRSASTLMKARISADLCTDEEFASSEIYVDFAKPHANNQFYVVGAVFPVERSVGVIGFQNPRDAGPFSRLHAKGLDRLLPHLQRALLIRARLRQVETQNAASESVLESLNHGVLLVSRDARVVYANRPARKILATADGLSVGPKGALIASRMAATNALQNLISSSANHVGGGAMPLSRPSGLRALEVIVAPLAPASHPHVPGKSEAVVFLRDPEAQTRPMPETLASLYRLTPAEARLATNLLANQTLEEIAAGRHLSRETLRTQLKELFRKTGTSRQSELIGFLTAGLAAAVRGE